MVELYAGPRLLILPGVRFEYTAADFIGRNVRFAPGTGAWLGTDPLESTANKGIVLPGVNLRYAASPNTNVRFAVTRSLARPNYYDIVPYRAQDDNAATIALGNADAVADDLVERRRARRTLLHVGRRGVRRRVLQEHSGLHLQLRHHGHHQRHALPGDAATRTATRRPSVASEVALQNRLSFLPGPAERHRRLRQLHVHEFARRSCRDTTGKSGLPGQSKHAGNLAGVVREGWILGSCRP